MALPPTAFKDLLSGADDEVYDRLRQKRCLSSKGRMNRDAVLEVMRETARDYSTWVNEHPGMTGANGQDRLASALLASPYVNQKAQRLADRDTRWD